jgi:hypothetical protein
MARCTPSSYSARSLCTRPSQVERERAREENAGVAAGVGIGGAVLVIGRGAPEVGGVGSRRAGLREGKRGRCEQAVKRASPPSSALGLRRRIARPPRTPRQDAVISRRAMSSDSKSRSPNASRSAAGCHPFLLNGLFVKQRSGCSCSFFIRITTSERLTALADGREPRHRAPEPYNTTPMVAQRMRRSSRQLRCDT